MGSTPKMPNGMKFLLGGTAGMMATCVVQPLDLVKTRMQISGDDGKKLYNSSLHCITSVIKNEGPLALYNGIGAALLRQASYTTARLGIYTYLNDSYKMKYGGDPMIFVRMGMAVVAGGFGAFVGTPAEVALVRMTADGRLPPEKRRNYKNVANALSRMVKEEGFGALFRGCFPTVFRAMVVNMAQLSSYSQAKGYFHKTFDMKEGLGLHFCAAMLSGLLTTLASMPVDIAKTRVQNMKYVNGVPEYKGGVDVISKIIKNEGPFALWRGIVPYYCRIGPHTVLTFIFLEVLNKAYYKYVLGTTGSSGL